WYEQRLGIADDWIRQRTGIVERRIASSGATSDLIVPAARECLEQRGITAAKLVEAGSCRYVLVCGADKMSAITNFDDSSTAMLFGDAAGVALVEAADDPELGIRDHLFRMRGEGAGHVFMPAGGSVKPATLDT